MPKYSNTNGFDVAIGCIRVPARSDIETTTILEKYGALPAGISRISDSPLDNDVLIEDKSRNVLLATPKSYAVPMDPWKQEAFIECVTGAITVALAGTSNTPLRVLNGGENDNFTVFSNLVDNIIVTSTVATSKINFSLRKA